jgi:hypothetical protein
MSTVSDTFYLEPGIGTDTVQAVYKFGGFSTDVNHALVSLKTTKIDIKGIPVFIDLPARYTEQLFLTTYSLTGQLLSRSPINPAGGKQQVPPTSSNCRVFRIETADRLPLYTGKVTAVR